MNNSQIQSHFDSLAPKYDFYKQKNSYYYNSIKQALKQIIPPHKRILDFGCGTGEILHFLKPKYGVGIDLSSELIKIANIKFKSNKNLVFKQGDKPPKGNFDYIIMVDVVEHLENLNKTLNLISKICNSDTKLIVTFVSDSWEPILHFLETIKFKMPEGPHKRVTKKLILNQADKNGLRLKIEQSIAPLPDSLKIAKRLLERLNLGPISFFVFEKK